MLLLGNTRPRDQAKLASFSVKCEEKITFTTTPLLNVTNATGEYWEETYTNATGLQQMSHLNRTSIAIATTAPLTAMESWKVGNRFKRRLLRMKAICKQKPRDPEHQ